MNRCAPRCAALVPYSLREGCTVCGCVWDTSKRRPELIAQIPPHWIQCSVARKQAEPKQGAFDV